jgi:hypothetical protein
VQVLSDPDGWPIWVCDVRPGREHDVTCMKAAPGLAAALEQAAIEDMVTLTDLSYEGAAGPALRMPVKKPLDAAGRALSGSAHEGPCGSPPGGRRDGTPPSC